jgi:molecular chaperone GrpE (heat shock protein)
MKKPKARQKQAAFDLVGALGEAGWAEADKALAAALAETVGLETALAKLARSKSPAAIQRADDAFVMLTQALDTVARKRGVSRFGEVGAVEKFDPERHEIDGAPRKSARVKLVAPGVLKGGEVLLKARAKLEAARKSAAKRKQAAKKKTKPAKAKAKAKKTKAGR